MKPQSWFLVPASVLVAAASIASAQAPAVLIQVQSYRFAPRPIHVAAGKPVILSFTNNSGSGHDFTAKEFFTRSTITAGSAPGGRIALAPHETKTITLIPRAGTYRAHCSHFLHASMGMVDEIIVN